MEYFDPFEQEPENEALKKLLIALSEDRTPDLRAKLYKVLLSANLLVMHRPDREVSPVDDPDGGVTLISFVDENENPVLPAFTDKEMALKLVKENDSVIGLKARALFHLALSNGIERVAFDPGQPHMLTLNGYEMQELAKGMIPVGGESIHRLDAETEYSLGPATEDAPNAEFRAALLTVLPEHEAVESVYIFHLGTSERPPELTLGILFQKDLPQSEMVAIMNTLFDATGHLLHPDDALNVMPLTDEEMESRLFALGTQIYSIEG